MPCLCWASAEFSSKNERHKRSTGKAMSNNPLLNYRSLTQTPPFADAQPHHFPAALDAAIAEHTAQIDSICNNTEPASFDNTVVALDRAGEVLHLINALFDNLTASETSPELQAVDRDYAPKLALHQAKLYLNAALFARVDAVHQGRSAARLQGADLRLVERMHGDFLRAGAKLDAAKRERLAALAEQLAGLSTAFHQNLLAAEASWHLPLKTTADTQGLPQSVIETAQAAAKQRDVKDVLGIVTLSRSLVVPFLTFSARRDLREQAYNAWLERGGNDGAHNNYPTMQTMLKLRQEMAQLLGFDNFAAYQLSDTMAKSVGAVKSLLEQVWPRATALAAREAQDLAEHAKTMGEPTDVQPWDWRYLSEKLRAAKYAINNEEVRPYFSLERMTQAMFDVAGKLFGIRFEEVDAVAYHPDVKTYRVLRGDALIGTFLTDNFTRPSKRGGAWMSAYRAQRGLGAQRIAPIIVNNNNFAKAPEGQATLLSADDVRTLFHEFGHGLHGLLSNTRHARQAGTSVLQDFVELPSQLLEHWAFTPEVLKTHARHVQTGEVISDELIAKLKAAAKFNKGFETVEYTSCVLVDLALHETPNAHTLDLRDFEAQALAKVGMPSAIRMRHRLPHFIHLFGGEYYASRYYVYLWAETLDADAFNAFEESGDVFDAATAHKLYTHIYSAGDSVEPQATYRAFRGADPDVNAMLKKKGLIHA
jgi:peptidyl-dipeptidase Dcp